MHTRLVNISQRVPKRLVSLLVYSSISSISLLISHAVLTLAVILATRTQHIGLLSRTSAIYTLWSYVIVVSGHIRQNIQLPYLLRSTCTQEESISSTLNGGYSSLTVAVRVAFHSLSTFHSITGTSLVAHGSVRRINDHIYSTLSTIAVTLV